MSATEGIPKLLALTSELVTNLEIPTIPLQIPGLVVVHLPSLLPFSKGLLFDIFVFLLFFRNAHPILNPGKYQDL